MIFSSVDLPEPLPPMMPTKAPCSIVQIDAAQRLEALVRRRAEAAQDPLGERGVHLVRDAERLVDVAQLDGQHQKCSTSRACMRRKTT